MYLKRIVILQQTNARFAQPNKELCGMVKLVNTQQTAVTVFVTNAEDSFGQWYLLLSFDGVNFSQHLSTLNNDTFLLPLQNLDNIACILVKKQERPYEVAAGQFGHKNIIALLRRQLDDLFTDTTPYEQFVASTQNFYEGVNVEQLLASADTRYKSVQDYSSAFERFYASGSSENYYNTVRREIGKVFLQFPPYYPLIRKYTQSFFVRIDFPSTNKYFVLGVLQREGVVRYICYGLPAENTSLEDKDFVFVENDPVGFWMLFQDAITGQITTAR